MYYYHRVAEELVFVLSSRCANSLKRTPSPPPPPPKNVAIKNGPTIPFLLLWPTTSPPSVYLESCGEICPRPFLSVGWKKEHGLQEEIKLNLKEMKFSTVKLAVLLILNLTGFPK